MNTRNLTTAQQTADRDLLLCRIVSGSVRLCLSLLGGRYPRPYLLSLYAGNKQSGRVYM